MSVLGGNQKKRVIEPIGRITGGLPGENLLTQLKADMALQPVFAAMFGEGGKHIFIDAPPSYNETIFPCVEFWFNNDSFQSDDTKLSGSINGRIVLPSSLDSTGDSNFQRKLALALHRFLGSSKHELFKKVHGLEEFAVNSQWRYERVFEFGGSAAPCIEFNLPYRIDMHLWARQNPGVDLEGDLDEALIGWMESYRISVVDDNTKEVVHEVEVYDTGQTNS
jgi:hypothetical protein